MPGAKPSRARRKFRPDERTSFAQVAHDLRTPLGVLSEVIARLGEAELAADDEGRRRFVEMGQRALRRVERMATILTIAADGPPRNVDPGGLPAVDLGDALEEAVARAKEVTSRRSVTVEIVRRPSCGVRADPQRLFFALSEIVTAAIERAETSVRIKARVSKNRATLQLEFDANDGAAERASLPLDVARGILADHGRRAKIREGQPRLTVTLPCVRKD